MDLGLRGKKAIVTGATRGIGRAIAETLAEEGCDVAICARDPAGVEEAVRALAAGGARAIGAALDVADGAAFTRWVASAGEHLGGIDIFVSNATGFGLPEGEEAWTRCYEVDLMGAVRGYGAARPYLERAAADKGDAAVVIISSTSALESSGVWSYGAMKAALIHVAKGIAKEGAPKRVRANVVSPGTVYHEGGLFQRTERENPERFRAVLARNPLGRLATPQEIANAVVFLASPASSFTTGSHLVVDGALTSRVDY